jgi:hypothetical protein
LANVVPQRYDKVGHVLPMEIMEYSMATRIIYLFWLLIVCAAVKADEHAQDSPEAVHKKCITAFMKKEYKAAYQTMTPEAQKIFTYEPIFTLYFLCATNEKLQSECRKIIDRHHVETEKFLKEGEGPFEKVRDLPQLMADLTILLEAEEKYDFSTLFGKNRELTKVQIDGDSASGFVNMKKDSKQLSEPCFFKKVKGQWYIDLHPRKPRK